MIGFHGIGNSHMFEDEEMGNYHPEIENGDRNGDNETGIIGALGNKLEKTFKNSLSVMKSEHAEKSIAMQLWQMKKSVYRAKSLQI